MNLENYDKILIYDFETDGFYSKQGYTRPIEIAVLIIDLRDNSHSMYHSFIKRRDGATPLEMIVTNKYDLKKDSNIKPISITDLTGITNDMANSGGDIELVFSELNAIFNEEGVKLLIVGQNILKFDNKFMNQRFTKYNYELLRDASCFDTAGEYKAVQLGKFPREDEEFCDYHINALNKRVKGLKYNMGVLMEYYEIEEKLDRHRAEVDVLYTFAVFIEQLDYRTLDNKMQIIKINELYKIFEKLEEEWQQK